MVNFGSILFNTDSYKVGMWLQYPAGTEYVYSYIEARKKNRQHTDTVFFGLQAFIKEYLLTPVTEEDVDAADKFWTAHGEKFNREGWMYIVKEHGGRLPIKISAVPEGTVVPVKNVVCVVENTDPKAFWLTTWVETALLRSIWYCSNVATNSRNIKKLIAHYLEMSGDPLAIDFKLHDFGKRGCSSWETSGLGGMSHLVNFKGTDTPTAIFSANRFYGADLYSTAFSIAASEHSTITSWGRENEKEAFRNMITQFAQPGSIVACVSDSYNIFEACKLWVELKEEIVASKATIVIRPDSGEPTEVLPEMLRILGKGFGFIVNDKGYKVLNNVRIIWGDGINEKSIGTILDVMVNVYNWSADNFAFGMGGALLQAPQRDDYGYAMKASAICIEGKWQDVFKQPLHASDKDSKKGRVTLYKNDEGEFYTGVEDWMKPELVEVFENGTLLQEISFEEVRNNAKIA